MYAFTETEFERAWDFLIEKYNLSQGDCIEYLQTTYIQHHKRRFVKFFTDRILHVGTTSTSRGEGAHAVLKRQLVVSTDDLKTVVDNLNLLLSNQRHDHLIAFEKAKMRYPKNLRVDIFSKHLCICDSIRLETDAESV